MVLNLKNIKKVVGPYFLCPIFQSRLISNVTDYPVPALTTAAIKDKLRKQNFPFVDGFTCLRLPECSLCVPLKKKTATGKSEVFINKQTGYFVCEMCKSAGAWDVFDRLLSKHKEPDKSAKEILIWRDGCESLFEKDQQNWKKIVEASSLLSELPEEKISSIFQDFSFMKCSSQVLEKLHIRISVNETIMFIPILSQSHLTFGHIVVHPTRSYVVPKTNCAGLLTYAHKKKITSAILVSNLKDFFALASLSLPFAHIVCLPYGVNNLPQISLPFLEDYQSITLWLGSVPCSWVATLNFAKKLGEKRCYVLRTSGEQYTPVEAVLNKIDIKKMLEQGQPTWHQAITSFASLRNDVLQELRNHEEVLGVRWSRFPALNKILRGHRRGELTVLTGPTGSGKTTFMAEYSLDLSTQGVNTLWGSFEVRNVRLGRTMLHQFVGKPLEPNLNEFDRWADEFEKLPIYFLTFHGQQSIKKVMDAVQHAAYIYDIGHVIIDNVQFMVGMTEESSYNDRFHKQDLIIHAFRTFATRSNCHVTLVIHPRKERENEDLTTTSIFGGAKAAQEADNVLIIQDKRLTSVKGKKYLQVCKNRYTGDLGIMSLEFDKDSLSYSRRTKKRIEE